MIINNRLESGKKNQQQNWLYFFFVCLEGTNCSLNCTELQLSLMGTFFLHLGAAMELKSSVQEDNLRRSLETSAKADLFLRPIFLYRTWISWFHTNLMTISRDDSSFIQSKTVHYPTSSHNFYFWGDKEGSTTRIMAFTAFPGNRTAPAVSTVNSTRKTLTSPLNISHRTNPLLCKTPAVKAWKSWCTWGEWHELSLLVEPIGIWYRFQQTFSSSKNSPVDCHSAIWLAAIVLYCQPEYVILSWKQQCGLIAGFREKMRDTYLWWLHDELAWWQSGAALGRPESVSFHRGWVPIRREY